MKSQEADIRPVPRWALKVNSTVGAVAVVLGAFGAHALKDVLQSNGNIEVWKTAVFYHLIHSILLVLISFNSDYFNKVAYFLLLVGVILFCGSLYLLSFFSFSWLGPITPVGGIFLILGWVTLSRKPN